MKFRDFIYECNDTDVVYEISKQVSAIVWNTAWQGIRRPILDKTENLLDIARIENLFASDHEN
jgi:hypothetical protein